MLFDRCDAQVDRIVVRGGLGPSLGGIALTNSMGSINQSLVELRSLGTLVMTGITVEGCLPNTR